MKINSNYTFERQNAFKFKNDFLKGFSIKYKMMHIKNQ